MERELRQASLSASSGLIWTDVGGNAQSRPAVQIFADVPGGGFLDVKPGTDALLVVAGQNTPRAATVGAHETTALGVRVTSVTGFAVGQPVLVGELGDASWGFLSGVDPATGQLTFASLTNVLPGRQLRTLAAGATVRGARARLYYVDATDQLVRLSLTAPRAPASLAEVAEREVLATGFENLQIDCQLDGGVAGFQPCPAALAVADPLSAESQAALGAFGAGQGPLLAAAAAATVRTVVVEAGVRSRRPVDPNQGNDKVPLAGVTLAVGGASDADSYVRRAYRVTAAVRNTSLGVF
jgi:hypothetical protein